MAEVRRLMRSWVTLRGTLARSRCRVVNVGGTEDAVDAVDGERTVDAEFAVDGGQGGGKEEGQIRM